MDTAKDHGADPANSLWYFAYGSNMSSSVICGRRNITPLRKQILSIPGYVLCFHHPGVPYREPAFASIRQRIPGTDDEIPDVCGTAYEVSCQDFATIVATEGGGLSYKITKVQDAGIVWEAHQPVKGRSNDNIEREVYTLIAKWPSAFDRRPTKRYMALLTRGAIENSISETYIQFLASINTFEPGTSTRFRLGSWLFLLFWTAVQRQIEQGIRRAKNDAGVVPQWFCALFETLVFCMWAQHDYLFAPIFGRGDGLR